MKRRWIAAGIAALATGLLCLLLLLFMPAPGRAEAALSIWYAETDGSRAAMEALAARCRKETGLQVETRGFADEAALAAACAGERPTLLWCSHVRAFDMAGSGSLVPLPEELSLPDVSGFCPLGSRLPLLLRSTARLPLPPASLESLLASGEQEVLAADCWADLLYEATAAEGGSMSGLRSTDRTDKNYVRLHNLLAQAAYNGAAVNDPPDPEALRRGELAAVVADSAGLAGERDKALGVDPLPLPQGAPLRYEVLQMGFARMREDPAAESFLLWLRQKNRDAQTALSFGLVPLQPLSAKGATALETTLIRLSSEAELVPIDPGAGYLKNRDACEQALRLSLDLLQ